MAVFGFQLLLTIIVLSVLNKISIKYSFARWILTKGGLVRYLHPTNEQLRDAINHQQNNFASKIAGDTVSNNNERYRKHRKKNRHYDNDSTKSETFYVPKNIALSLDSEPLHIFNLVQLPYYNELQWLVDFSLCTVLVYFITEFYYTFLVKSNTNEYNLSIVWCLLSLGFVLKILFSLTATYFSGDESIGERSICIMSFCVYLLVAMIILIADEEMLEFGLVDAYRNFSYNAYRLLESQGVVDNAYGPSSFLMIKFWLAITCGIIGALFAFPGLRIAQMHFDALVYAEGNQILSLIYHFAFISPLAIILSWIKPLARYYFVEKHLISNATFESSRLLVILFVLMLRFVLFRKYLQSYLNIAPQKISYLKRQTGKMTNIDVQKLIARVSHYLSVASLQYLTPLLLCLFLTLVTKSTGDYQWMGTLLTCNSSLIDNPASKALDDSKLFLNKTLQTENNTINVNFEHESDTAKITLTLLHDVFNPTVLRGFNNFLLWWTCTVWFSTSVVGFVYNSYFKSS